MRRALALLCLLALLLAGCNGSNGAGAQPVGQVDFQQFARDQLAATADDTDPVEINNLDFLNQLNEDEDALADLFD